MAGQNTTDSGAAQTKLCSVCTQFYGSQATDYLCSKCYKERSTKEVRLERTSSKTAEHEPKDTITLPKVEEIKEVEVKKESVEEQTAVKPEKDHSRCLTCSKKVGLLGFKCQCDYTFCRNHRMPESHNCTFDFGKVGKERLAKENIVVKAEKVIKF